MFDFEQYLLPAEMSQLHLGYSTEAMCINIPLYCRTGNIGTTKPSIYDHTQHVSTSMLCSALYNNLSFRKLSSLGIGSEHCAKQRAPVVSRVGDHSRIVDGGCSVSSKKTAIKSHRARKNKTRNCVKFADECGQCLVTFLILPPPVNDDSDECAPCHNVTPDVTASVTDRVVQPPLHSADVICGKSDFSNHSNHSNPTYSHGNSPVTSGELTQATHNRCVLLFEQPAACFQKLNRILQQNNVALENVKVVDEALFVVTCSIKVKNLCPVKRVFVRCTHDHWRSHADLEAGCVHSGYDSELYDTFSFSLTTPAAPAGAVSSHAEFAICYQVAGQQFWDNNNSRNYVLQWYRKRESEWK